MKIDKYNFGSITINGKEYTKDVIIFPNQVLSPWWREKGHNLTLKDLEKVIEFNPNLVIIGTGAEGIMKTPQNILKELNKNGIKTITAKTGEAVILYNQKTQINENVVACLHLTC
jgi:hypothetical protein